MLPRELHGQRFGRLVACRRAPAQGNRAMWLCQCDCGLQKVIRGTALTTGNTLSCGCANKDAMAKVGRSNKTHGQSRTPEYRAWARMLHRCYHPDDVKFHLYGGRGIHVCDRWRYRFESFLEDMGKRPSPWHSLDRINGDGNYGPANCRWATSSEQNKNRRPFNRNRKQKVAQHGCA